MSLPPGRPAAFLDRDDTLLVDAGYMSRPEQVVLFPGVHQALLRLGRAGFSLVLVSNQSGVNRGWFSEGDVAAIQARMLELLPGVRFDGFEYCFHRPDENCACRKPRPGLILRAASRLDLDLGRSVMIGDRDSDVEAGQAAGCTTVLLRGDPERAARLGADHSAPDLASAVDWILGRGTGP